MKRIRIFIFLLLLTTTVVFKNLSSQRIYKQNSAFAIGNWYKVGIKNDGVYKIDGSQWQQMGFSINILSNQIKLFGNIGGILPEKNSIQKQDDITEIPVKIFDGGDGVFNTTDYFIFYAQCADNWKIDTAQQKFIFEKNIYSDLNYYYVTQSNNSKRIIDEISYSSFNNNISNFNFKTHWEVDSINFLSSGKNWYGRELSNTLGKSLNFNQNISLPSTPILPLRLESKCISRSGGNFSNFNVTINNLNVLNHNIAFTNLGILDPFAVEDLKTNNFITNSSNLNIQYQYTPGSSSAQGWIDYFEIQGKIPLQINSSNDQLIFSSWDNFGTNFISQFNINNPSQISSEIWDISNIYDTKNIIANNTGLVTQFRNKNTELKQYICFGNTSLKTPEFIEKISSQNLHFFTNKIDFLIICPKQFVAEAQRLYLRRTEEGLIVKIVFTEEIWNEFGSGQKSPTAIRDYVKMIYDKSINLGLSTPKYLLLLGDASFDFKKRLLQNDGFNLVPSFQSSNSLNPLSTYNSDDFFGYLDDNDDVNSQNNLQNLDIAIGRIPSENILQAKNAISKILNYQLKKVNGLWPNDIVLIADDEDFNLHLNDAEYLSTTLENNAPNYNVSKVYIDAFSQESNSGGSRAVGANIKLNSKATEGALIINYSGHGGPQRLAEEVVIDETNVSTWNNKNNLPLLITATCDFAPYDNPREYSFGENLLMRPENGAVGLISATRVVFASSNRILNQLYLDAFSNSPFLTVAEQLRIAKNNFYLNYLDIVNNRKFTYLGDPSMKLNIPNFKVSNIKINNKDALVFTDTIKALSKCSISGEIIDANNQFQNLAQGKMFMTVFDKPKNILTKGNDPNSIITNFREQQIIIFKGNTNVKDGRFKIEFIVPKDINLNVGKGKISLFGNDSLFASNGYINFNLGSIENTVINDNVGPEIKLNIGNKKSSINKSLVNNNTTLYIDLFDSSGINTTGLGIGHDITATLDNDTKNNFILNDFYTSNTGSFQSGFINYPINNLTVGAHTLTLKAFDIFNNSSTETINFEVVNNEKLEIKNIMNYPNPFLNETQFWFETNILNEPLKINLDIFTISGKWIKNLNTIKTLTGNKFEGFNWDGNDNFGNKIAKGVYLYRLTVKNGIFSKSIMQKLFKL